MNREQEAEHMTREHYLDNSATTPVLPEAAAEALRLMTDCWGNPSSLHSRGFWAKKELDAARATVARRLGAAPEEIIFTSGGTEANNMALLGAAAARRRSRPHRRRRLPHSLRSRPHRAALDLTVV